MYLKLLSRTFFFLSLSVFLNGQEETPLSGVINVYAAVVDIDECANTLIVDDPSGFESDMQVILIQMKGASINQDNDDDFGSIEDQGAAGLYEKNKIIAIDNNRITLERTLFNAYDPQSALQLVSMPVYENAITVDTVRAQPWDGSTGGIVAFQVQDQLRIDAPIDVTGQGFRGGEAVIVNSSCNFTIDPGNFAYPEGNWRAAPKGESIAEFVPAKEWGKGSQASGGGGGNDHNAGGGGGGNVTAGGMGGRNNAPGIFDCTGNHPGRGGKPLPNDVERIYMGGGGGAGHSNNTTEAISGGNGGGIVMIFAPAITRLNTGIYADGQSPGTGEGDGGGGAGAGGTIMLEVFNLPDNILMHAFGGNGASIDNRGQNRCMGPGGGGSGGRIMISLPISGPTPNFQVNGGQAGRTLNSSSCSTGSNGAEAGENGEVVTFSGFAESSDFFTPTAIQDQTTRALVCEGNPVLLQVETSGNNLTYQWQINRGSGFMNLNNDASFSGVRSRFLSIAETTPDILNAEFRLLIEDDCGQQLTSEIITVEVGEVPDVNFSLELDQLTLNVISVTPEDAEEYRWDFGDGNTSTERTPTHVYDQAGDYDVKLVVRNACGSDSLTQFIPARGSAPTADFTYSDTTGCLPVTVNFSNASTPDADSFQWNFQGGTPATATSTDPSVVYNMPGVYQVRLVVTDAFGTSDTLARTIRIVVPPKPEADFEFVLDGLNVTFDNLSENADRAEWDFGDGSTSTELSPVHDFPADGSYEVRLIAGNACGSDTTSTTIEVKAPPQAGFVVAQVNGCSPVQITFQSTSTGEIDRYAWSFQNGEPEFSTEENPTVTYNQSGAFEVVLVVSNEGGSTNAVQLVEVNLADPPVADFEGGLTDILTLSLKSTATEADSLYWIFGADTFAQIAADSFFSYTFPAPGSYQYGLIAKNQCGMDTLMAQVELDGIPQAEMTVEVDSGCAPLQVEISSPFFSPPLNQYLQGGGATGVDIASFEPDENGVVKGTVDASAGRDSIQIRLRVGSQYGSDTLILNIPIDIDPLPRAAFSFANTNNTVSFNNQSTDSDAFLWDFGDGSTSSSANPGHTYDSLGDYEVRLIAFNDCGQDTIIQSIRINNAPAAGFEIEREGDCAPIQFRLIDRSIGLIDTVYYEFVGPKVVPVEEENGLYEVMEAGELFITMVVENELGRDEVTQSLQLAGFPVADFSSFMDDLTVTFTDESSDADAVLWDFGDGSQSQDRNPVYAYAEEGEYVVSLIVRNGCGEDTLMRNITVGSPLVAKFTALNSFGCAPHLVQFRNRSTGNINAINWSFPGGSPASSTEMEPQVIYTNPGVYPVTLTVEGPLGTNSVTIEDFIRIVDFPDADFSYEVDGFQVRFTNLSMNAESYRWDFGDGSTSTAENPVHTYSRGGLFTVTLNASIATCGNSVTMNIPVMLSEVEDAFSSPDLKVFPNPARGVLFIETNQLDLFPIQLELISARGQLLERLEMSSSRQIDISRYPAGLYYLRLRNAERQWIGKLVHLR